MPPRDMHAGDYTKFARTIWLIVREPWLAILKHEINQLPIPINKDDVDELMQLPVSDDEDDIGKVMQRQIEIWLIHRLMAGIDVRYPGGVYRKNPTLNILINPVCGALRKAMADHVYRRDGETYVMLSEKVIVPLSAYGKQPHLLAKAFRYTFLEEVMGGQSPLCCLDDELRTILENSNTK
jgi:hypothetical protein